MHDPFLGVPACVIVSEEAVAEGSHEEHRPYIVARVLECRLRLKAGDLGHALQSHGSFHRLEGIFRVEYEEDVAL